MHRQGFIDWMKALGMLLIVFGHVVGDPNNLFNLISQPIYTKQLGVCLFIFIMGWSLANEHRTDFRVVFNRLVPIYFYGVLFTLLLSVIFFFTKGDINESNYLPFFFGLNVLINYFPANPTIWYIGTYIHILLFWYFCLRGKPITKKLIIQGFVVECVIRAVLLAINQDFVAYMILPNWLTVFLLGGYLSSKKDTQWEPKALLSLVLWILILALWASPWNTLFSSGSLPFRDLTLASESASAFVIPAKSLIISFVYLGNTWMLFELLRRLPKLQWVVFFARNSLITFIIHMPLIYGLMGVVYEQIGHSWLGRLTLIMIIFVGCTLISELLQRLINMRSIQEKSWQISADIYARMQRAKHL